MLNGLPAHGAKRNVGLLQLLGAVAAAALVHAAIKRHSDSCLGPVLRYSSEVTSRH